VSGLVPLVRADDLGVHSRKVVVNVVLLLVGVSLDGGLDGGMRVVGVGERTGASIHCRNFCSSCAQPCTL
jgi:hypothetical protein